MDCVEFLCLDISLIYLLLWPPFYFSVLSDLAHMDCYLWSYSYHCVKEKEISFNITLILPNIYFLSTYVVKWSDEKYMEKHSRYIHNHFSCAYQKKSHNKYSHTISPLQHLFFKLTFKCIHCFTTVTVRYYYTIVSWTNLTLFDLACYCMFLKNNYQYNSETLISHFWVY